MSRHILVTGGAGFIGSHTVLELLAQDYSVTVVDSFCNSHPESLRRVEQLSGKRVKVEKVDIRDKLALERIFTQQQVWAVIHFAGLKAVGESTEIPLEYFSVNVGGSLTLLSVMREVGVRNFIFSSSATVYGGTSEPPYKEDSELGTINPYGKSKLLVEEICREVAQFEDGWKMALLRYFNPVGAHPSGRIGEDPQGIPNNLMPYAMQVAVGVREQLSIFGNDYDTPDGTCQRDYIHVVDLAKGHVAALRALDKFDGCEAINLGTGKGISVLEVVKMVGKTIGRPLPSGFTGRRAGDDPVSFADPSKARRLLGWQAELGLEEMCRDSWNWQRQNPQGFAGGSTQ
jgi:UDP-glucose 4-epimerase